MIITPKEASKELRVSMPTIYKLLQSGAITHAKAGNKYLISRKNLDKYKNGD